MLRAWTRAWAVILAIGIAGCGVFPLGVAESDMADRPVLAKLQVPDDTLLMYEAMVVGDPDRTGNWRFRFSPDGCFYHARNDRLWITEPEQLDRDDPELFWSDQWPDTPIRCLTEDQLPELRDAIDQARFPRLKSHYASGSLERTSSPVVERWTAVIDDGTYTVVVEPKAAPARLAKLRETIDALIANAPLVDAP
jgi:hypothetical protein